MSKDLKSSVREKSLSSEVFSRNLNILTTLTLLVNFRKLSALLTRLKFSN